MTTVKTGSTVAAKVNYTEANIATMREMYKGADNKTEVAAIAKALGKTVPSVRAKLSSEGIYKVAEKAKTATGDKVTKMTKSADIGKLVGLNEPQVEALAKTTNAVLDKLLAKLSN